MYPEASIKLSSPKNSRHGKVKPANKVSSKFDKRLYANLRSHEQRRAIRPLVHWLNKKTSDEKRGTQKMQKGLTKGHPIKKEAPQKHKGA
jgi:hypothetical protein